MVMCKAHMLSRAVLKISLDFRLSSLSPSNVLVKRAVEFLLCTINYAGQTIGKIKL